MTFLSIKILAAVIGFAVFGVLNHRRAARGRQLVDDVENGRRCLGCEGAEVVVRDGAVHCGACGYVGSLKALQSSRVSDEAIAELTQRDNRRGL